MIQRIKRTSQLPQRRERQIASTRNAILEASTRVFSRSGYQNASMNEIAAEAGYTAPSLYNYFKGKEEIFEALVERLNHEILAAFDDAVPKDLSATFSFERRVELLLRRQLELAEHHRDAIKLVMALQSGSETMPSKRASKCQSEGFRRYLARMTEWMREASQGANLAGRTPEDLAFLMWGIGNAFYMRWLMGKPSEKIGAQLGLVVDLFIHGALGARSQGDRS